MHGSTASRGLPHPGRRCALKPLQPCTPPCSTRRPSPWCMHSTCAASQGLSCSMAARLPQAVGPLPFQAPRSSAFETGAIHGTKPLHNDAITGIPRSYSYFPFCGHPVFGNSATEAPVALVCLLISPFKVRTVNARTNSLTPLLRASAACFGHQGKLRAVLHRACHSASAPPPNPLLPDSLIPPTPSPCPLFVHPPLPPRPSCGSYDT